VYGKFSRRTSSRKKNSFCSLKCPPAVPGSRWPSAGPFSMRDTIVTLTRAGRALRNATAALWIAWPMMRYVTNSLSARASPAPSRAALLAPPTLYLTFVRYCRFASTISARTPGRRLPRRDVQGATSARLSSRRRLYANHCPLLTGPVFSSGAITIEKRATYPRRPPDKPAHGRLNLVGEIRSRSLYLLLLPNQLPIPAPSSFFLPFAASGPCLVKAIGSTILTLASSAPSGYGALCPVSAARSCYASCYVHSSRASLLYRHLLWPGCTLTGTEHPEDMGPPCVHSSALFFESSYRS